MKLFTVYAPARGDPSSADEEAAFVKEGFCWPAVVAPLIWLIWHRMWLELATVLLLVVLVELCLRAFGLGDPAMVWAGIAFNILFAFEANDLRRYRYERKGWRYLGAAMGRDLPEAERDFFGERLRHDEEPAHQALAPRPLLSYPALPRRRDDEDVIGSLPSQA